MPPKLITFSKNYLPVGDIQHSRLPLSVWIEAILFLPVTSRRTSEYTSDPFLALNVGKPTQF